MVGTIVSAPGYIVLFFAHEPLLYFAGWVILGMGGSATLSTGAYIMLNEVAGRGAKNAIGGLMLVTGLSSSIFWPTTSFLSDHVGWRGTCLVYAAMMPLVCLPLFAFGLPRRKMADAVPAHGVAASGPPPAPSRGTFYLLVTTLGLYVFVTFGMGALLIELFKAEGLSATEAISFGSMLGPGLVAESASPQETRRHLTEILGDDEGRERVAAKGVRKVLGEHTYRGSIAVRLGPVALTFAGVVKFEEIDEKAHTARVAAQGTDAKGRGGATAASVFRLEPAGSGSKVRVHTNLNLSGAVAQYGRSVGIIQATAAQLMNQFAKCLQQKLAQGDFGTAAPAAPVASTAQSASRSADSTAGEPPRPISGFALLGKVIWSWIAGLFKRS